MIFLKLLLSFCKDNRMNTELVIPYYTILEEKPVTCSSLCNEISFL